jgi:hypothetical protein
MPHSASLEMCHRDDAQRLTAWDSARLVLQLSAVKVRASRSSARVGDVRYVSCTLLSFYARKSDKCVFGRFVGSRTLSVRCAERRVQFDQLFWLL